MSLCGHHIHRSAIRLAKMTSKISYDQMKYCWKDCLGTSRMFTAVRRVVTPTCSGSSGSCPGIALSAESSKTLRSCLLEGRIGAIKTTLSTRSQPESRTRGCDGLQSPSHECAGPSNLVQSSSEECDDDDLWASALSLKMSRCQKACTRTASYSYSPS